MAEINPVATEPLLADVAPTPWPEVRKLLAEDDTYWLATVRPGGPRHVRPVLAVWLDGRLHFCASPSSRKGKNLTLDSQCVLATGGDTADLVVEGLATRVDDQARLQRVAEAYAAKYEWHVEVRDGAFYGDGAPTAGPPPYEVYEVTPRTIFGFGTIESFSPTRWRFDVLP